MLLNLHEKDVAQTTAEWMTQLQQDLEESSREFAAAMAEYEKQQDEAFKILACHSIEPAGERYSHLLSDISLPSKSTSLPWILSS